MMAAYSRTLALSLLALASALTCAGSAARGADSASAGLVAPRDDGKLRIIIFGAHPDDAEFKGGGTALQWARLGHHVKMVSVTNGDKGHWRMQPDELAQRRLAEARAADRVLGVETEVLPIHDGELEPTLENRRTITRVIRNWNADIVIAHRPWDYHPDHRYVGVLVQDAAFMVAVPMFCPDTPALKKNPVFFYSYDAFQKPYPFRPDVVVGMDDAVFTQKLDAVHELASQVYEGGALGSEDFIKRVPPADDVRARKAWLRHSPWALMAGTIAARYRDDLVKGYGAEKGNAFKYAEAFELCEYGSRPTSDELAKLFPFVGRQ